MIGSESHGGSKSSLLCVYYPQQLLPGLAAVISYRRQHGMDIAEPLTVLVWSHHATENKARLRRKQTFEILLEKFPWVNIYFPEQDEIKLHLRHNTKVLRKAVYLRNKFGRDAFLEIYYAHDISADFIAQSAMQAFPEATRICFGDALGIVYTNEYFTAKTYAVGIVEACLRPLGTVMNMIYRLKRVWLLPPRKMRLEAEYAALILPCDPGGDFLRNKKLIAVEKVDLSFVLNRLNLSAAHLLSNRNLVLEKNEANSYLVLLGAYSESKFTTEKMELELYIDTAINYIPKSMKIVLKAHPSSSIEKARKIKRALAKHHDVMIMSFQELPIELLSNINRYAGVISFSYSSIALKYLYNTKVVHALSELQVEKYFLKKSKAWMQESNDLYIKEITKLQDVKDGFASGLGVSYAPTI